MALRKLAGDGGKAISSFGTLLSALVVLVSRLTGDEDIALGTSNGDGMPFVLRTAIDLKEPFERLLVRVEEV